MSKNLTIDEGGESSHFDGVKRLKTKLAGEDGGSCYWVPDDETQAWPTFIMNNGMHVAAEDGHYGFSEANVNVFIPTPFQEWDVWIDDMDVPHIKIDDITIDDWHIDDIVLTIDPDLGTPIVDMEGIDMDGFEIPDINIYMPDGLPISDIDFKTDIHVWTDPDDHTKIHVKEEPNGEEIVLDYDDIDGTATFKGLLDIRYNDSTGKWIIEAHTKIKVDDVVYEAGDEIKSWSKEAVVDFTMKVEQEISVDFPDLDPDFMDDFDVILDMDNMDLDMDGIDMDIDMPLLKMPDLDDQLPDEIRIMHVPDKTSYKDGEAIDLDGIVVQAYKNGTVWQNNKYINGYIPVHELEYTLSETYTGSETSLFPDVEEIYGNSIASFESVNAVTYHEMTEPNPKVNLASYNKVLRSSMESINKNVRIILYKHISEGIFYVAASAESEILEVNWSGINHATFEYISPNGSRYYGESPQHYEFNQDRTLSGGYGAEFYGKTVLYSKIATHSVPPDASILHPKCLMTQTFSNEPLDYQGAGIPEDLLAKIMWIIIFGERKSFKKVTISWPRPIDGQILSASFDITIESNG